LWLLAAVMAFAFAYTLQFTSATLSMGKELSDTESSTGFQDAITPPWQTNLAIVVYLGSVVVIGVTWWQLGWVSALGVAAVIFIGSYVAKFALPKPTGNHYKGLIIRSMVSRHAGYVRDGDALKAAAVKILLVKAGINTESINSTNELL